MRSLLRGDNRLKLLKEVCRSKEKNDTYLSGKLRNIWLLDVCLKGEQKEKDHEVIQMTVQLKRTDSLTPSSRSFEMD